MDDILKVLLGAALSIAGGFLSEEAKKRRRLWAAARLLLHEMQLLFEANIEDLLDIPDAKAALAGAVAEYKLALFSVDRVKFEEHWQIYRDLARLLNSAEREDRKYMVVVIDVRRRLAALLGAEQPGSAELLGVRESGPPTSKTPPTELQ